MTPFSLLSRPSTRFNQSFFLLLVSSLFLSFLWVSHAHAANRYWVGAANSTNDRWEDTANWSTAEKGTGGASVPGASDFAIFSYSGTTVRIRSAATVGKLEMKTVWTGSILQGTGTLVVGSGGFLMGSGTFVGGNARIAIAGNYTQTGGSVSYIQNTMTLSGSFSITNGGGSGIPSPSFASTGTIVLDGAADQNFTKGSSTTLTLQNLTLQNSGDGTSDDVVVNANGGLNLSGALTVTLGNLDLSTYNTALHVENGISIANAAQATLVSDGNITASGSISVGASGAFTMSGSTTLTMNGDDQNLDTNNSSLYNLTIASSSGTTLTSNQTVTGTLQVNAGSTLTLGTYTVTATSATISNAGTITENTGAISHAATSFLITNASYSETATFNAGGRVFVTLTDTDENIDGTAIDTVSITIGVSGDSETITLSETAVASGIFRGSIGTQEASAVASDSILQVTSTSTITARFTDAQDALTNSDTASLVVGTAASSSTTSTSGGGGGSRQTSQVMQQIALSNRFVISDSQTTTSTTTTAHTAAGGSLPNVRGKLQVTVEGNTVVFQDVPVADWYAPFVMGLVNRSIISGYKDARGRPTGEFQPASDVTFAEIAKMAAIAAGVDVNAAGMPQNRSARGEWSAQYIAALEDLGVSLFSDPSLNVNAAAPRGAVVQIVLEAFGVTLPDAAGGVYEDVRAGTDHAAAIEAATEDGIVSGDDGQNRFRPTSPINRAETTKVIENAIKAYGS